MSSKGSFNSEGVTATTATTAMAMAMVMVMAMAMAMATRPPNSNPLHLQRQNPFGGIDNKKPPKNRSSSGANKNPAITYFRT
ncbi:MAG: hypothetical protein ACI89E_001189, partial [Planctomycetota bacterium]